MAAARGEGEISKKSKNEPSHEKRRAGRAKNPIQIIIREDVLAFTQRSKRLW
jgi:hypothetical protein